MIDCPFSSYNLLVIDGNHRIAKYLFENKAKIPAIRLTAKQAISYNLPATYFNGVFYLFGNDIKKLLSLKQSMSDEQLLEHSLLSYASTYAHFS